jgi:hypothetical protein
MKNALAFAALSLAAIASNTFAAGNEINLPPGGRIRVTASFSPNAVLAGQSTTFSWNATGQVGFCDISGVPGINFGGASGSHTFTASTNLQANVTCEGNIDGAIGFANATLTVQNPNTPPVVNVSYSPASIYVGQSSTFSWSSQYASSCTSTGGVAVNSTAGSTSVSPGASQSTTVTCTGTGGSTSATANLTVSPQPPAPPYVTGYASPSWLQAPGYTWIHWNSTNANYCNLGGTWGTSYQYFSFTTARWVYCYGPGGTGSTAIWVHVSNFITSGEDKAAADVATGADKLGIDLKSATVQHSAGDFNQDGQEDLLVVDIAARQAYVLLGKNGSYEIAKQIDGVDRIEDITGIHVPAGKDGDITLRLSR